jgi:predicted HicB family RNase H-like nuclease
MAKKPPPKPTPALTIIAVRVPPDLKNQAELAAKEDGRSLSKWTERLIMAAVKKK